MLYRPFSDSRLSLSNLGFGCMRFPCLDKDPARIDVGKAHEMLEYAFAQGVTLFDTAYPYHRGKSEEVLGAFLDKERREQVLVQDKLPIWMVKKPADFDRLLDEQLARLHTNYIDVYLVHALNQRFWTIAQKHDVFRFLERAKQDGRIRYAGFSFHDAYPLFAEIVDAFAWDSCLIHLNYMDQDYQAGTKGLYYAAQKGLSVMIMEPLRGGRLAQHIPADVSQVWHNAQRPWSPAEYALRWLWNFPEVTCVLSGMSTLDQVKENIKIASNVEADGLTSEDLAVLDHARTVYKQHIKVGCTQCGYCDDCPQHVAIKDIFELYNDVFMYDSLANSRNGYRFLCKQKRDASLCVSCGECEDKCPQHISIIKWLQEAHRLLAPDTQGDR